MSNARLGPRTRPPRQPLPISDKRPTLIARLVLSNVALAAGLLVMPLLIIVGYLVNG